MSGIPDQVQERLDELRREFEFGANRLEEVQPEELKIFSEPEQYQRHVLPFELARLREEHPPITAKLLVLLCGTTLQPLLLSAAFVEPAQVLLVGSDTFEGRDAVERIRPLLRSRLVADDLYIHDSDPTQAYAAMQHRLRELLGDALEGAVVDITGGKKTMVAAAFLVSSRLGLPMIYVDGEYNARARLPAPGTVYVRMVKDPAVFFGLRELDQAAALFGQGSYHAAAALYQQVADDAAASGVSLVPAAELRKAAAGARAAGLWEEADYVAAVDALIQGGFAEAPGALRELKSIWGTDEAGRLERFASRKDHVPERGGRGLIRFAADRLAWAYRAQRGGRHRAAFLLAFSACDTALEGLVIWLIHNNRWQPDGQTFRQLTKTMFSLMKQAFSGRLLENGTANSTKEKVHSFKGLGEPYRSFALFAPGGLEELREHRNALVHRISGPDPRLTARLLDGQPGQPVPLAERLLLAIGDALEIGAEARTILHTALGDPDLAALRADLRADL